MHILKTSSSSRECFENSESGGHCNVRAIRYKRILFFYGLPRRVSFRSLRLRLRQCLLWCRVHVRCRAAVWPRIRGAAHSHTAALHGAASHAAALRSTCSRASVLSAAPFYVRPRSMVPRAAQRLESSPCCRAVVWIAIKGGSFHSRRQSLDSRGGGWSSSDRRGSQSLHSRGGGWSSSDRCGSLSFGRLGG